MIKTAITNLMQKTFFAKELGFYIRRLHRENVTKVITASVASLALVLQLTIGILPFTSTPVGAVGDDNLIRNGVSSKEELLAIYDSGSDNGGHNDIKQIYTHFGVSRQDLANATIGSYKTNDFNGQIKTVGRTNWPNAGRTAVAVTNSSTTVYTGPYLDNANSQAFVMPALVGKRSIDGQWFAITLNCGNVVYTVPPPPVPQPLYTCDSLRVTKVGRTEFSFTTKYTAENVTFKSITYVITNEAGQEIARTTDSHYVQETPGTYTVNAHVTVIDNGQEKTVTDQDCSDTFTVKAIVTPISTVPTPKCDIPGKERLPANSPDCVVTSVVVQPKSAPVELPKTGLSEDIMKVFGLGSLIASTGYYAASRRGLLSAFLNR
jgi:hypothetical protein